MTPEEQCESILSAYKLKSIPRRVAIQAGIRNIKERGLDQLEYGRRSIAYLEKELRRCKEIQPEV